MDGPCLAWEKKIYQASNIIWDSIYERPRLMWINGKWAKKKMNMISLEIGLRGAAVHDANNSPDFYL